MIVEKTKKGTLRAESQPLIEKKPIESNIYYSIRDITDPASPYFLASASTIFRALKCKSLEANYLGRKVLLKGSSIHAWLSGK